MLTKILVTALVILGCYLFLRYKRSRMQAVAAPSPEPKALKADVANTSFQRLAMGLLSLSLLAAIGFFIYGWYDDQTLLDVRVINSQNGEEVKYQAYKGDLEGRSFITIYGQQVSIADSERMEVSVSR